MPVRAAEGYISLVPSHASVLAAARLAYPDPENTIQPVRVQGVTPLGALLTNLGIGSSRRLSLAMIGETE